MKFSYNWLQKHFEDKLPEAGELAIKVGLHSFELEGVEEVLINGEKDTIIEWDILPNRSSDCLCYMGMAKEIGAVLNMQAKTFSAEGLMTTEFDKNLKTSDFLTLDISDKNLVKRATKRLAVNVNVAPSPQWLKDALESQGQKSINNVVDITNYVMWVTGQPVHAFDYDKLAGEKDKKNIKITFAKNGEKITDLSGEEHELDSNILVISDGEKSLDIAGIKGGNNSGVDENTKRLMLSAVNFEFENIRNTSKKLKLATDASKRFENEVPLRKTLLAMAQMSFLLKEIAGATVSDEIIDTNSEYKNNKNITCSISNINRLLGIKISKEDIIDILYRLDLRGKKDIEGDEFNIEVPEDRLDLNIWQDIAEEVGRIYGYENIEEKFPSEGFSLPKKNKLKDGIRKVGDILVENGFYEIYNRSIVKSGAIKLQNSLNSNATAMRETLLSKLKERAEKNLINEQEPKLFEIGKVFVGTLNEDSARERNTVVDEFFSFAGIIGKRKIKEKQKEDLFYRTKGYLENIFDILNIKNITWKQSSNNDFVAEIWTNNSKDNEKIGDIGINFWELNIEKLIKNIETHSITYKKPSKYPKMDRDVAFWVDNDFTVEEAREIISEKLPKEAISLELFDIFKNSEKNKKSFAFNIVFQSDEKTLEDTFVNNIMDTVYKTLEDKNFEIR